MTKLAFIGAGRIAQAIIGGLINQGFVAANMTAADPDTRILDSLPGGCAAFGRQPAGSL